MPASKRETRKLSIWLITTKIKTTLYSGKSTLAFVMNLLRRMPEASVNSYFTNICFVQNISIEKEDYTGEPFNLTPLPVIETILHQVKNEDGLHRMSSVCLK